MESFKPEIHFLEMPLSSIGISESFVLNASVHGYNTLKEILDIPLTDIIKMEWFTPHMFNELSNFVKKHGEKLAGTTH